jgi:hypothetical protein
MYFVLNRIELETAQQYKEERDKACGSTSPSLKKEKENKEFLTLKKLP